jgi:cobalamin biosynthesis protein CbiD
MVGKLAKFAAGHESVHSRESSQDFTFLGALARRAGAEEALVEHVHRANTAQEVADLLAAASLTAFNDLLCQTAWTYAMSLTHGAYPLDVLFLARGGEVLGRYPQAERV